MRIVDQTLPTDRRTRLLEINSHDQLDSANHPSGKIAKSASVFQASLGIVNGAGTHDDEDSLIVPFENLGHGLAVFDHCFVGRFGHRVLGQEIARSNQWVQATNVDVLSLLHDYCLLSKDQIRRAPLASNSRSLARG